MVERIADAVNYTALCMILIFSPITPGSPPLTDTFYGETYTITDNAILDSDGNVTEWLPESDENMPGWDCKTMGNHKCGVTDPFTGETIVVEYFTI